MELEGSLPHSQEPATIPIQINPIHDPHPISQRSTLILSSHLRLVLLSGLLTAGFHTKILYAPLLSSIRATCPAHLSLLDLSLELYLVRSTEHKVSHYVVFSIPVLPRPS